MVYSFTWLRPHSHLLSASLWNIRTMCPEMLYHFLWDVSHRYSWQLHVRLTGGEGLTDKATVAKGGWVGQGSVEEVAFRAILFLTSILICCCDAVFSLTLPEKTWRFWSWDPMWPPWILELRWLETSQQQQFSVVDGLFSNCSGGASSAGLHGKDGPSVCVKEFNYYFAWALKDRHFVLNEPTLTIKVTLVNF